jgi:serine/threonine protein kinase/tetratricopeptide (TPR) repeat protein
MAGDQRSEPGPAAGDGSGALHAGAPGSAQQTPSGEVETGAARPPVEAGATPSSGLSPGSLVGRYEIVEHIGSGGTGVVYRARDPQLSRAVALKLIARSDGFVGRQTQARLLREAQILAQLSHPNVVAAYDIGIHDGALYIVMELIDGVSLSEWLRRAHSHAKLLEVLIAAGRGLAAAHAAGVVHRDFKPANVMVSRDERVRVVDFGLARSIDGTEPENGATSGPSSAHPESPESVSRDLGAAVEPSQSSRMTGTPGYIAPEQFSGKVADSRSDQFSYAVTAFVALVGAKPYPDGLPAYGSTLERPAGLLWPPSIPRKLRDILSRGLALRAEDRYPSVAALVADLERAASPRRRKPLLLGLIATATAGLALSGVLSRDDASRSMCNMDDSAFRGVWDPARRAAVERAFRATGRSNAGEAFELVSTRLDAFERQWIALRRDSCEATHLRREQPERVMALRGSCLDRARAGAKTLVDALTEVDDSMLARAAGGLPPSLAACSEIAPNEPDSAPTDPAIQALVDEVELGIAVTRALITAGNGPRSIERAASTLELARSSGHLPAIAAATAQLGRARMSAARTSEEKTAAEALLRESIQMAAASSDGALLARTSSYLFVIIGYQQRRIQEAEAMLPTVEAVVTRAGNEPEQRTELSMGKGIILSQHMKFSEAIQAFDEVIRLAPSVDNEVRQYGINASTELAGIYTELGDHEAAIAAERRTVAGLRAAYGAGHPRMLVGLVNLAWTLSRAKRRDAALEALEDLRRLAATMPPSEPRLENLARIEGEVWHNLGDCGRAVPFLRAALGDYVASYGPDHPRTTEVLTELGTCLAQEHQTAEAITHLERALANRRGIGETPSSTAEAAFALAEVLWGLPSQKARAVALVEEARSLWKRDGADLASADEWLAKHEAAR